MSTVLLVDDERVNNDLIRMFLEMDGFNVHACATLEQANEVLDTEIDALVIDCNLAKGASGLDLVRMIREGNTAARDDIVIIVTSGDDRREKDAAEANATKFYLKPFSPTDLSKELKQLIGT